MAVRTLEEPAFMLEIVAELSHLARRAPEISQRSGRERAREHREPRDAARQRHATRAQARARPSAAPRISDLGAIIPSTTGKVELETLGDDVARGAHHRPPPGPCHPRGLRAPGLARRAGRRSSDAFESGAVIETGELVPSRDYVRWTRETPGLADAVARLGVGVIVCRF